MIFFSVGRKGRSENAVGRSVESRMTDRVFAAGHCTDTTGGASSGVLLVTETDCVYRAVRTESLNVIQTDFRLSLASSNNQQSHTELPSRAAQHLPSLSRQFPIYVTRLVTGGMSVHTTYPTHTHSVLQEAHLSVCCVGLPVASCRSPHKLLQ